VAAERLQKIIATAGIASRRKAEELITQGRVTVNGQTVTELGTKADPERDHIKVDGKLLRGPAHHITLVLNKPKGYVTTVSDPEGRPTVMDLVKHAGKRIYPVGRLDFGSEGLLLLTNDGDLANYLTRAASHVPKTYLVKVAGVPAADDIEKLRHGIRIGSKPGVRGMHAVRTAPAQVRIVREAENPWYEVTLIEGKNRQIRRMFEEIGHHVEKIKRVRYGSLTLDVEPGKFRELTPREVAELRKARPERRERQAEQPAFKANVRYLGKARPERRGAQRERAGNRGERTAGRAERQEAGKPPARTGGRAERQESRERAPQHAERSEWRDQHGNRREGAGKRAEPTRGRTEWHEPAKRGPRPEFSHRGRPQRRQGQDTRGRRGPR
jgi:23S rRNA pseudouridine2605 synthase